MGKKKRLVRYSKPLFILLLIMQYLLEGKIIVQAVLDILEELRVFQDTL